MELFYKDEAIKQLKRIGQKDKQKVKRKIESIKANPLMGKRLQGEHLGEYSVRSWPLRIIYTFDAKAKSIEIITVDYRGSVY
jgi:mRNA-degrading endonuclease RelE of RelBE toxin-antitoxin system